MSQFFEWIGLSVAILSTVCAVLFFGIVFLDYFGSRAWKKLLAFHDIYQLQHYMETLNKQGKTWSIKESNHD